MHLKYLSLVFHRSLPLYQVTKKTSASLNRYVEKAWKGKPHLLLVRRSLRSSIQSCFEGKRVKTILETFISLDCGHHTFTSLSVWKHSVRNGQRSHFLHYWRSPFDHRINLRIGREYSINRCFDSKYQTSQLSWIYWTTFQAKIFLHVSTIYP